MATNNATNNEANPLKIPGSSSGTTTVQAAATASGTLTLPAATDTLAGKATTDAFTNKDLTSTTNTLITHNGTNVKVATSQTTTSTTYTDLTTAGPAITVTTGTTALVTIFCSGASSAVSGQGWFMGFAVSGATTVAAADASAIAVVNQDLANNAVQIGATFVVTGLTAGSNTFTAKYKASGTTTCTFSNRQIGVVPL